MGGQEAYPLCDLFMSECLDDKTCEDIIKYVAKKLGIELKLIATRLMSEDDKNDMRNGELPIESLECHIKSWVQNGIPDYAHGLTEPMENSPL